MAGAGGVLCTWQVPAATATLMLAARGSSAAPSPGRAEQRATRLSGNKARQRQLAESRPASMARSLAAAWASRRPAPEARRGR
jgi:hypothetical protein